MGSRKSSTNAPPQSEVPIPKDTTYTRLEFLAILALTGVFILLFVWFTVRQDQRIFQYYVFAVMTTLVFSGVLKAVGAYRRAGIALGGSVVIFAAVLGITNETFKADHERENTIGELNKDIAAKKDELKRLTARMKEEKKMLALELKQAQEALDNMFKQSIKIFTFRENGKPMREARLKYLGEKGELIAKADPGIGRHTIPSGDLLGSDTVIWVTVDPSSVPERPNAVRKPTYIEIDRLTYKIRPLELKLYLRDEGW